MKTLRLVIGIISMGLILIILFQSCAAGMLNIFEGSGETSGFAGLLVSVFLLIAGSVGVSTYKKAGGGAITSILLYAIAGLIGVTNYGSFADLQIWGILSFIFAVLYLLSIFVDKMKDRLNTINSNGFVNKIDEKKKKRVFVIIGLVAIAFIGIISSVLLAQPTQTHESQDPSKIHTQIAQTIIAGIQMTKQALSMESMQTLQDVTPVSATEILSQINERGTRENPVPLGQPMDLTYQGTANFQIIIQEVIRGQNAWIMVNQANIYNESPPEGMEYVLAKIGVNYQTSSDPDFELAIDSFSFKSVSNNQIFDTPSIVEPEPELSVRLFPGGYGEGYITVSVYVNDPAPIIAFEQWLSFDSKPYYFAIQ